MKKSLVSFREVLKCLVYFSKDKINNIVCLKPNKDRKSDPMIKHLMYVNVREGFKNGVGLLQPT